MLFLNCLTVGLACCRTRLAGGWSVADTGTAVVGMEELMRVVAVVGAARVTGMEELMAGVEAEVSWDWGVAKEAAGITLKEAGRVERRMVPPTRVF
jgi:hypothetical protein